MTDRDTFAAAALTGLLANGDYSVESIPMLACRMADAMLRERGVTEPLPKEKRAEVSGTLTDEEREAVEWSALALGNWADERIHAGDLSNRLHKTADTLRGLLDRLA